MAQPPLLSLRDVSITFGGKPLFEGLELNISKGDRICLVGRNGSGKSTLLKMLVGDLEPDKGERFCQPGCDVTYLPQDPDLPADMFAVDYVMTSGAPKYEAEAVLDALGMPHNRKLENLSGGERRRVSLAHALAEEPKILLLDEPTNHLDLPTIEWLEGYLRQHKGALLIISHDRIFLEKVSNRTLWLDRGNLHRHNKGYADFDAWSEQLIADEQKKLERLTANLRLEEEWVHRGVTARRRRNQGRLRKVQQMRAERQERLQRKVHTVSLSAMSPEMSSKLVLDLDHISKSYGEKPIIKDFSTRILRGDRIGVLGPNGAGKTTLLKMMVGQIKPDEGRVEFGANIDITYFDQMREALNPKETLWENLCETGGDQVLVQGRSRHVMAYLKDFLFDEKQVRAPVGTLSGGEKNRLALAKCLAKAGSVLVLDEPTNDLDMDTLDLLQEVLDDYQGTLILVSHDRDFLDRLVTSIIAVEGKGVVHEYVGGYQDYLRQRQHTLTATAKPKSKPSADHKERPVKQPSKRLSYNDKREWEALPDEIAVLETEIAELESKLDDSEFYQKDPETFNRYTQRLEAARRELSQKEDRWLELELMVQ